jgi:hypothetical protein
MVSRVAIIALGSLLGLAVAPGAMAERIVGHPRVNEVKQRVLTQRHRIEAGYARGQIGREQAARDMRRDARIERQFGRDEAMHGGHVTFAEQHRLNRERDRDSMRIFDERHEVEAVRRAEADMPHVDMPHVERPSSLP